MPNVRMAHWLMKYTNKESTFHNMTPVPNTHVVGTRLTESESCVN